LETTPCLGYFWGDKLYEQDIIEVVQDSYILCFAYQWEHEEEVKWVGLPQFGTFNRDKKDDKQVVKKLWELLHEADVATAHNGKSFDFKIAHTRFLLHGMKPPSPYQMLDTKQIAKKYFRFPSNKLDELSRQLEQERKLPHTGKKLWLDAMAGDPEAWKVMEEYNKHDVVLLRNRYKDFLPWIQGHPNRNIYSPDGVPKCPNCGSAQIAPEGHTYNLTTRVQKWRCRKCGRWFRGKSEARTDLR